MKSYKDLDVYKRSYGLALKLHSLTAKLPRELQFDLCDQVRRASRSIPSNIAEAYGRNKSVKDKINFLSDSLGSNNEILFNIEFMKDSGLISVKDFDFLSAEYDIVGKQLFNLIKSLKPVTNN